MASHFCSILEKEGAIVNYFSLEQLPKGFPEGDLYGERTIQFKEVMETHVERFPKLVFVVPEYNASFPGVFKSFLDAMPKETLQNKKIALIGTSTGRGGNSRGIDHLTNILHYLGSQVFHDKLLVSSMLQVLSDDGFKDPRITQSMELMAKKFISY